MGEQSGNGAENIVWEGRPSQVVNLPAFLICLLLAWLVVPLFYAAWKWLAIRCTRFELTTERFRAISGILTRRTDELELYRVKDTELIEPFYLRIFSLGNVVMHTSDRTTPRLVIPAIPNSREVRERIRRQVEEVRKRRGVREFDVD
jgi:uncharacterized membrane protein YdbT with pleckstrin-like domain